MSKTSGLGDNFYVAQFNISGDVGSVDDAGGGPELLEDTGIDKFAMERLGGIIDGTMEFTTFFNTATDFEHDALKSLPLTDRVISYFRGTTLGNPAASIVAKQADYKGERGDDGSLTCSVEAVSNGFGVQWGNMLTAGPRTDTGATNGTSYDFGTGSKNFGLAAFLHVFAFTGTSATVKIQSSSDNAVGDPFADVTGGGFTLVTGRTSQRIQTATNLTVERYLRVVTTGTFSSLVFAVNCVRYDIATVL